MIVAGSVLVALAAAITFAWAAILQQEAALTAPEDKALRLSLITELLRRPKWVAGITLLVLGFGFQLAALAFGPVALVQPIVATELAFAVPLAMARRHRSAGRREWMGIGGVLFGVSLFLIVALPKSGDPDQGGASWLLGLLPVAIAMVAAIRFGAQSKGPVRAISLGAAAGLAFGVLAVLSKSIAYAAHDGASQVITSWPLYAAIVCGIGALVLSQSAYQAGPLAYSMPVVAILEPIVAVVLGASILGERLSLGGAAFLLELLAVVVACVGIWLLTTSPIVLSIYEGGHPSVDRTDRLLDTAPIMLPDPVEDGSVIPSQSRTVQVELGPALRDRG